MDWCESKRVRKHTPPLHWSTLTHMKPGPEDRLTCRSVTMSSPLVKWCVQCVKA